MPKNSFIIHAFIKLAFIKCGLIPLNIASPASSSPKQVRARIANVQQSIGAIEATEMDIILKPLDRFLAELRLGEDIRQPEGVVVPGKVLSVSAGFIDAEWHQREISAERS
ncbi:hypothetical protein V2G26_018276 [Clonostachys chloroleuca]